MSRPCCRRSATICLGHGPVLPLKGKSYRFAMPVLDFLPLQPKQHGDLDVHLEEGQGTNRRLPIGISSYDGGSPSFPSQAFFLARNRRSV